MAPNTTTHDLQGVISLQELSKEMPDILKPLENRSKSLQLQQVEATEGRFLNAKETLELTREKDPTGDHTLPDIDTASTYRPGNKVTLSLGLAERSFRRHCKHFNCALPEGVEQCIAKEFHDYVPKRRGETVAEDVGHGLAIMRQLLVDFEGRYPVGKLKLKVSIVTTVLFETSADTPKRILLCQPYLPSGTEFLVSGSGKGLTLDKIPAAQFLHAFAHWSYEHLGRRGAVLNMKAIIDGPKVQIFSCGYYRVEDQSFGAFLTEHECCELCNALELWAFGAA